MAVQVGLKNLHYAILTQDDLSGVAYDTPVKISGAINAKVNPTTNTETLYADDGPSEVATALGEIGVELNVADLSLEAQAALLGHTISNGVLIKKSDDQAPYVAIGFQSVKSNGKYRFIWLYKGKFSTPENEFNTKEDTPTFQTPTITGSFVKRDYDERWEVIGDEDMAGFTQAATWFNAVVNLAVDTTPPTISTVVPANNATTVAVSSVITWTFSEAILESTVVPANFMVQKSDGTAQVAGSLSVNAAKTIVTFTPSSNLSASTQYMAIIGVGVKDLAGNTLASPSVTKFTTA